MAASNFRPSLSLVLAHEGGYVNHPRDPGGATNFGVTQQVYDAYRKYHGLKLQSVKYITPSEVSDIYNKNYWRLCRADSLPYGLDYAVFDFAVNSGVSRAVRYLQRIVGVKDDGIIGMITLSALESKSKTPADVEKLIAQYCANRMMFLRALDTFPTFGKGWTRRVIGYRSGAQIDDTGVLDYATFMARRKEIVLMPPEIGAFPGETVPNKVDIPFTEDSFVEAPEVNTAIEAKKLLTSLMAENDELADKIGSY